MSYNDQFELMTGETGEIPGFSSAGGRRRHCKSKGLKGKAFRDCVQGLRKEDKDKTKTEKKELKTQRKELYWQAVAEGKIKRTFVGKVFKGIKKVGMAGPRNAFNALVSKNAWGLADKLDQLRQGGDLRWQKMQARWIQFGGGKKALDKAINRGKGKAIPRIKPGAVKKAVADYKEGTGADGYSSAAGFAATIAAATPLIVVAFEVAKGLGLTASGEDIAAASEEYTEMPVTDDDIKEAKRTLIPGVPNAVTIGGGISIFLGAGLLIYYGLRGK